MNAFFWASLGVVVTVAAHVLLAMPRADRWSVRLLTSTLWVGCMVYALTSHASYFMASLHMRGEQRKSAVAVSRTDGARPLSSILATRADVQARMAALAASGCSPTCAAVRGQLSALKARLGALDEEAREEAERREQAAQLRQVQRDAMTEPAILVLSKWLMVSPGSVELAGGVLVGLLLDGLGCVAWLQLAGRRESGSRIKTHLVARVPAPDQEATTSPQATASGAGAERSLIEQPVARVTKKEERLETLVARARAALASGAIRGTQREVRDYLECSQRLAAQVRRSLSQEQSG